MRGRLSSLKGEQLSQSMRDRLRTRTRSLVEKSRDNTKLRQRLGRDRRPSRVDPADLRDDEGRAEQAMERSWQLRQRLRTHRDAPSKVELPSAQEQWDFFTKVYDTPGERDRPDALSEAEPAEAEIATEEAVFRGLRAAFVPEHVQARREQDIYFSPTFMPVPLSRKLEQDVRRMEEEGLYTGAPVDTAPRNVNSLEQRLLREPENGRGWFADDGAVIRCPTGIANFPTKPELVSRHGAAVYCKPMPGKQARSDGLYKLDVDVSKIMFTHHPLFSKEHVLTMRLLRQYRSYLQRNEQNMAAYYGHKMHAVQYAVRKKLGEGDATSETESLHKEIRELRHLRNIEEATDKRLLEQIVESWRLVKQLRQQLGYATTSYQLLLRQQSIDADEDRAVWEADLRDELAECEAQFHAHAASQGDGQSFDSETKWQQLKDEALRTRRNPGESVLVPMLGAGGAVTPADQCPPEEQQRRAELAEHKVFTRIYFNGLEVCKTASRALNADFCVTVAEIYGIHVYEWPQSIEVKIYESGAKGRAEEVATVGVPIPRTNQITVNGAPHLEEVQFSGPQTVAFAHAAVGAGTPVDLGLPDCATFIPRTTGVLACSALWGRAKDVTPLVPPLAPSSEQLDDKIRGLNPNNLAAIQEIQELLRTDKFDPNDPANSKLTAVLKGFESELLEDSRDVGGVVDAFRLEAHELSLVGEEEFWSNRRFRLLELRNEGVQEFRAMRQIPAYESEIDPDIFKAYEKRLEKEKQTTKVTGVDSLRAAGNRYATMVRNQVAERFYSARLGKTYEDVVNEIPLPAAGNLAEMFGGTADVSRKLKPMRQETRRVAAGALAAGAVKIRVNLQNGANLPVRAAAADTDAPELEPLVEVSFQGASVQTSVVPGKNPAWQQLLTLDFVPPNSDYSPSNLRSIMDVIYLNLFDQVVSKLPRDDREGTNTIHEQVERKWLGSIELPFSTLYWNSKIEGSLRLKVPPVFLGYSAAQTEGDTHNTTHPYVKLLLALEPSLPLPESVHGKFDTIESAEVVTHCERWAAELSASFPRRRFLPLVLDTHGRTALLCRFLRPIRPPPEVERHEADLRKAAAVACRVVSLMPFVSDPVLFPGLCDMWSTCDEFVRMLCGDEEEHAVLLWCWLAGLSLDCHLLVGSGLPEGPRSAYVLAHFADSTDVLFNASDGGAYATDDTFCPLLSVGCAATPDNIWANVQLQEHPSVISFDMARVANWRPLFTKAFPNAGLESVQPSSIDYAQTDASSVSELRGSLEREIKQRFDQWRPHAVPQWNFHASKTLRALLPALEDGTLTSEQHSDALAGLSAAYKICGFPLQMGYESVERVVAAVRATNVHVNFDANVEFALAVHVHPYSNNVLSVWVYVASLVRLR